MQMTRVWFALVQKDEKNVNRNGGPEDYAN
jgi:hypothetical protein